MKNLLDDLDPDELQRIFRLIRPFSPAERAERLRQLAASGEIDGSVLAVLLDYFPVEASSELSIGEKFGKYTITDLLGEGGMGRVYQAWDPDLTRNVAIKLIRSDLIGLEEEYRRRGMRPPEEMFREESAALASLQHAGIVSIYERGIAEGPGGAPLPYCAMELVHGEPLHRHCEERRLGTDERLELMRQVCAAVGYAHSRRIVHRDLKPGNILIDHDGQPRILDFGLAMVLDKCSPVDLLSLGAGTPGYLAPEQISHEFGKVGYATDVYALGVILYELLAKRRPYPANPSEPSFRVTVTRKVPQKLGGFHRDFEGEIEEIAAICLAKHPSDRYPNANVLQSVLSGCLEKRRLLRLARELGLSKEGPPPLPLPPVSGPLTPTVPCPDEEVTLPLERTPPNAKRASQAAREPGAPSGRDPWPATPVSPTGGMMSESPPVEPVPMEFRTRSMPRDPAPSTRRIVWAVVGMVCLLGSILIFGGLIGGNRAGEPVPDGAGVEALRKALLEGASLYDSSRFSEASEVFGEILEKDPENELARLGRAISLRQLGEDTLADSDLARLEGAENRMVRQFLLSLKRGEGTSGELPSFLPLVGGNPGMASPPPRSVAEGTPAVNPPSAGPRNPPPPGTPGEDPASVEADYLKGLQQIRSGEKSAAIATLVSVNSRSPNYKETNMYLASAYYETGRPEEAIRCYDEIIAANPEANNAFNMRGQVHFEMGNIEEAIADLSECLRLTPDFALGYNFRGNAYLRVKDYPKAEADFTTLISHKPNDSVPHELRGRARIGMGKFAEALEDLNHAAERNSGDADIYYFRSKAERGLGNVAAAEADLAKALQLNPGVVEMHEN